MNNQFLHQGFICAMCDENTLKKCLKCNSIVHCGCDCEIVGIKEFVTFKYYAGNCGYVIVYVCEDCMIEHNNPDNYILEHNHE